MPYRICKVFEIESGHQLSKHADDCRFPHGHSRRVEVVLEAGGLDGHDMVCDFAVVKKAASGVVVAFDHALCVNTRDRMYAALRRAYGGRIVGFEGKDPTTEVIARTLFDRIAARLAGACRGSAARLVRVRVWETPHSWAEYEGEAERGGKRAPAAVRGVRPRR
jgi:6-pyruvoyltetrahydropterin/6-carboxytetrahydropterin synthase